MLRNRVEIRNIRLDEVTLVGQLFNQYWRKNHVFYREPEILIWQYYQNPYSKLFTDDLSLLGTFDKDRLIGVLGYMPFLLNNYGDKKEFGCHFCNWYADASYGFVGLKLLYKIMHSKLFSAMFAFDQTTKSRPIYKRLNWKMEDYFPRYILVTDKACLKEVLVEAKNFYNIIDMLPSPVIVNKSSNKMVDVFEIKTIKELEWDDFYWNSFASKSFGPAREKSYLMWRYGNIPRYLYRFIVSYINGAVSGLIIFRVEQIKNMEEKVVRIMELICTEQSFAPLVNRLIEICFYENVCLVDFFCTYKIYEDLLESHGFTKGIINSAYNLPYLFQPLESQRLMLDYCWKTNSSKFENINNEELYITKGDADNDRPN